ncbi:hypothetical protein SynNOUM97013_00503 [Synechococcus sp. NOUM97013]|nr:hypothetical protein SynNOUM97013_00503 [Synechococcus sp. NOUM97013]
MPNPIPVTPAWFAPRHDRWKASQVMSVSAAEPAPTPIDDKTNDALSPGDRVLCPHCQRTANNGIRCMGMCVADNEY